MMQLLIDAGNTRIKWALVNGDAWLCTGDLLVAQVGELSRHISDQLVAHAGASLRDVRQIWVSNVAGKACARHIRAIATDRTGPPRFVAAQASQCGVRNRYTDKSQLGSDRWAALIAAWHLVRGVCLVVNSGTATTIDALSAQGEFLGGLILPGVELMQRSLAGAAAQLDAAPGNHVPFPLNTPDAMHTGAIRASCGAIAQQYALLGEDRAALIVSGGAAAMLQPGLKQTHFGTAPRIVDNLVLSGLLLIAGEADQ